MSSYKKAVLITSIGLLSLVVTACGGGSAPAVVSTPVPLTWTFGGSAGDLIPTTTSSPPSAPVTLSAYNAVSASLQFGPANTANVTISVADALNNGDISPNALPPDNATSGATPILYISFYNGTSATVTFGSVTPSIQVNNLAGFGSASKCELDSYANNVWSPSGATGNISGTAVTINSAALANNGSLQFLSGQAVDAIACK